MKNYKYQRLTNAEKKEARNEYFNTPIGKETKKRLNRLIIWSLALIIFGIYLLIEAVIKQDSVAQYIYSSFLIIVGIGFLIGRCILLIKRVNHFIVTKRK